MRRGGDVRGSDQDHGTRPDRTRGSCGMCRTYPDADKSRREADNQGPGASQWRCNPGYCEPQDVNDAANPMCKTSETEHPMPELNIDAAPRWSSAPMPIPRQPGRSE